MCCGSSSGSEDHHEEHAPRYLISRRSLAAAGLGLSTAAIVSSSAFAKEASPAATPTGGASPYPLTAFDVYVAGLHCAKEDPQMQMEAHHFCQQLADGTIQCAVFDGNTVGAKLIGVEYIISGAVFDSLPEDEHQYWHPHNYEVFSGQLTAPHVPDAVEMQLMTMLVNSYGKTWHAWHTGRRDGKGKPGDAVPLGPAMLQWSFNRDGEADASLVAGLADELHYDPQARREERKVLVSKAKPQVGVDDLKDAFPDSTPEPPPGVEDVNAKK